MSSNDFEGKEVTYHRVEGTDREWVEYPSFSYITTEVQDEPGVYTLICSNMLNNQPQLVQELKELYSPKVSIYDKWIRIEVERNADGTILSKRSKVHNCTPPIIKEGFTHTLSFVSKDENYLKFIQWDVEKKLAERNKLQNLDIEVEEKEDEFKILGKEQVSTVDIPEFMNINMAKSSTLSLNKLFKEMDDIVDSFFKRFD